MADDLTSILAKVPEKKKEVPALAPAPAEPEKPIFEPPHEVPVTPPKAKLIEAPHESNTPKYILLGLAVIILGGMIFLFTSGSFSSVFNTLSSKSANTVPPVIGSNTAVVQNSIGGTANITSINTTSPSGNSGSSSTNGTGGGFQGGNSSNTTTSGPSAVNTSSTGTSINTNTTTTTTGSTTTTKYGTGGSSYGSSSYGQGGYITPPPIPTPPPPLNITMSPSSTQIILQGTQVSFRSSVTGGTPPYSYRWYNGTSPSCLLDQVISSAVSSSYSASPTSNVFYCVLVIDSENPSALAYSGTANVVVATGGSLVASISPSTTQTILSGNSVTFTSTVIGGIGPYSYQWYSGTSSTCSSDSAISGATSASYTTMPTSNTVYCLAVTDSEFSPVVAYTATTSVTVMPIPALSLAISPSTTQILISGSNVAFTSTITGGITPYSYQWYSGASSACTSDFTISAATSSSYTASPPSNTFYCLKATDSESPAKSIFSATTNVVITTGTALQAVISPSTKQTILSGNSVVFTSTVIGGKVPYSYQWYAGASTTCSSDSVISGATASSYTATPASNTIYCLKVTDSESPVVSASSATTSVAVTPISPPSVSILPSTTQTISSGNHVTFTSTVSGGKAQFTYQWYNGASSICTSDTAISGATGTGYTLTPSSNTFACLKVTDSESPAASAFSTTTNVVVITTSALIASISPSTTQTIPAGNTVTFSSTVVGGTPPYAYQWYSGSSATCTSDSPISGATGTGYSAAPASSTMYCLKITDSESPANIVYTGTTSVVVTAVSPLSASISPSSTQTIPSGSASISFTSSVSGGKSPYNYQWYNGSSSTCTSDTAASGATASAFSVFATSNTYVCLKITDSESPAASIFAGPTEIIEVKPLSAVISPSTTQSISSGGSVAFSSTVTGGLGPLDYQWYSGASSTCTSDSAISGVESSSYLATPTSNTFYCMRVTDSESPQAIAYTATTEITVTTVTPPSVTISPSTTQEVPAGGASVVFQSTVTNGKTPYSYQWYGGTSSSCNSDQLLSGDTGTDAAFAPSSNTFYCVKITDSESPAVTVASATTEVIAVPALAVSISPATTQTVPSGSASVVFTSTASGGYQPYNYQWYTGPSSSCSSDTAISGATNLNYAVAPTSNGFYCVKVTDSEQSFPASVYSSATQVVVT